MTDPSPQVVESLIDINTKLQQSDAAFGALTYAREHLDITHHEEWYEKLHRWEEALAAYDRKAMLDPDDYPSASARCDVCMLWESGSTFRISCSKSGAGRIWRIADTWRPLLLLPPGLWASGIPWTIISQPCDPTRRNDPSTAPSCTRIVRRGRRQTSRSPRLESRSTRNSLL